MLNTAKMSKYTFISLCAKWHFCQNLCLCRLEKWLLRSVVCSCTRNAAVASMNSCQLRWLWQRFTVSVLPSCKLSVALPEVPYFRYCLATCCATVFAAHRWIMETKNLQALETFPQRLWYFFHHQNLWLRSWFLAQCGCCSLWRSKLQTWKQTHFKSIGLCFKPNITTSKWHSFDFPPYWFSNTCWIYWWWTHTVCLNGTHRCAGFLHCQHLVHRGRAVACRMGVEWGTGRAESWARGPPRDGAEGAECPDLRHPHWNHRGHGETDGSCLREKKKTTNCDLHSNTPTYRYRYNWTTNWTLVCIHTALHRPSGGVAKTQV